MNSEPNIRQRALLPGISASAWANLFAVGVLGFILALILLGVAGHARLSGQVLALPAAILFALADGAALVVAGTMVFVRLTAERRQGYTTIDGFRLGAGASTVPGAPDTVDTVEARTGIVLRHAGEVGAPADAVAARMMAARRHRRSGQRPILLDPRPRRR